MKKSLIPSSVTICMGILLASCMKVPDTRQNFGPEVSFVVLKTTLNTTPMNDPYSIKKGEFVYSVLFNQIENLNPMALKQSAITITNKEEEEKDYVFTIVKEIVENKENQMKPSKTEGNVRLTKKKQLNLDSLLLMNNDSILKEATSSNYFNIRKFFEFMAGASGDSSAETPPQPAITFHNLNVKNRQMNIPSKVKERSNCGGLKNCTDPLNVTEVNFDRVQWSSSVPGQGAGNKYSFTYIFSAESPYFAGTLLSCLQMSIPTANQRVSLLQCEQVLDFTFGHD